MKPNSIYFDGSEIELPSGAPVFAGAALLGALGGAGANLPAPEEPPYLFCANGSCRDCNLLVDGLADVPACRLFLAPGMSFRSGEGAGEGNALSRRLGPVALGARLVAEVVVVGAGRAGKAAAESARRLGVETVLLEARAQPVGGVLASHPVGVIDGEPFVMEAGKRRMLHARAIILANGARDAELRVPGSTLAGVLPLALLDRYVALGRLPGKSILVAGKSEIPEQALLGLGARSCISVSDARALVEISGRNRVERARVYRPDEEELDVDVDVVFLGPRKEPALEIARALGCRAVYDRDLGYDRLVAGESGATSLPAVFACGDVVRIGTEDDAVETGRLAGRAAAIRSGARGRPEC